MEAETTTERIPIRDLVRYFLRLGLMGFGGPVALVGQMDANRFGATYGSGRSMIPLTTLNTAVFAPMPSAMIAMPRSAKPGLRRAAAR